MKARVTIHAHDLDLMVDLVRRFDLDLVRTTARVRRDGGYRVDAIVNEAEIAALAAAGCEIHVLEDAVAPVA